MDLSGHTSLAPLAEAIQEVQRAAAAVGVEIYVAGALARDLWMAFGHGLDTGRRTSDVDFAVQCRDWPEFERLRTALRMDGKLAPSRRSLHSFRHRNGTDLDLVPYGGIERPDRTIAWPPEEDPVLNVLGFSEVAATAVPVVLPGNFSVPVIPLHALALLKLVAWNDRWKYSPGKDAPDLFLIARKYLDAGNAERFFEIGWETLERPDFDYEAAGAEMLGRDLATLCNGPLKTFLSALLARETDPRGALLLAHQMTNDEKEGLRILVALRRGFK